MAAEPRPSAPTDGHMLAPLRERRPQFGSNQCPTLQGQQQRCASSPAQLHKLPRKYRKWQRHSDGTIPLLLLTLPVRPFHPAPWRVVANNGKRPAACLEPGQGHRPKCQSPLSKHPDSLHLFVAAMAPRRTQLRAERLTAYTLAWPAPFRLPCLVLLQPECQLTCTVVEALFVGARHPSIVELMAATGIHTTALMRTAANTS
mmetsp:Transcript_51060/g.119481  ORF Transcript_51060/g.119481 Transcript_51060/m.119481 type:complete len:202 (+) Transcript_51060:292-897(+)